MERGYANTTVREICEHAGVSPPVIYYHFGSKQGVFQAVAADTLCMDGFVSRLRQQVAAASSPEEKLRAFICVYLAHFPTDILNPGLHLGKTTEVDSASLEHLGGGLGIVYEIGCKLIAAGIAAGRFRTLDVEMAGSCLMGTVDSYVRAHVYLGARLEPDSLADFITDLLLNGLRTQDCSAQ
jgi:AcrR family transcriptional regulator